MIDSIVSLWSTGQDVLFHVPKSGAGWTAWVFFVYAVIGDVMPFATKILPNGPAQAAVMVARAGFAAITADPTAGTITLDLNKLRGLHGTTQNGNGVPDVATSAGQPSGVDTKPEPAPFDTATVSEGQS